MATSAIGPGFITQTTVFTQQLLTSFGFVILISIALDIATQLNTWRIIAIAEKRAQDIANDLLPGMGYFLALLIVLGGLAFNIGNVGGAGLGINILFPIDKNPDYPIYGAMISAGIALVIFWVKETAVAMDKFSKFLGIVMISLTLYVALKTTPPVLKAIKHSFFPEKISLTAIVTLVGGTVGGYISFAGAHRLLDAGIKGPAHINQVTQSGITGILLASVMRILLFIAALGVITGGGVLDLINPAASVFQIAGGSIGLKLFGIVLWCAAITSVVGSAYTSVSFLRTFHPWFEKNQRWIISFFIICSTLIFAFIGKPKKILVFVGALNGLILPISLSLMLLAAGRYKIIGTYKHPFWMSLIGWIVVLVMSWMGLKIIVTDLPNLLN